MLAGAGAILGHVFPVWLGFNGGKGVATALGVLLGPVVAGRSAGLPDLARGRLSVPLFVAGGDRVDRGRAALSAWLGTPGHVALAAAIAVLVILRHHDNIRRLMTGTESRIGAKKTE